MKLAQRIVDAVLIELDDRRGIGQELRAIRYEFPDTWRELKRTLVAIVDIELPRRRTTPKRAR